jgi:hypothetical protein
MGKEQCIKLQEHIDDEQFIEQQEETVEKLADWFRTNKIPHSIGCCAMFRLMERILAQDIQSRD